MPLLETIISVGVGMVAISFVDRARLKKEISKLEQAQTRNEEPKRRKKDLFVAQNEAQTELQVAVSHRLETLENYLYAGGDLETSTNNLRVEKIHLEKSIKYNYYYLHRPVASIVLQWDRKTQKVTPVHILDDLLEGDKRRTRELLTELARRIIADNKPAQPIRRSDLVLLRHQQVQQSLQTLEPTIDPAVAERLDYSLKEIATIYSLMGKETNQTKEVSLLEAINDIEYELLTYRYISH